MQMVLLLQDATNWARKITNTNSRALHLAMIDPMLVQWKQRFQVCWFHLKSFSYQVSQVSCRDDAVDYWFKKSTGP